jgi:hypothetical protein
MRRIKNGMVTKNKYSMLNCSTYTKTCVLISIHQKGYSDFHSNINYIAAICYYGVTSFLFQIQEEEFHNYRYSDNLKLTDITSHKIYISIYLYNTMHSKHMIVYRNDKRIFTANHI